MMPFDGPHYVYSRSSGDQGTGYEIRIGIQVCEAVLHFDSPTLESVPNPVRKVVDFSVLGEFAVGFRKLIDRTWPQEAPRSFSQVKQYIGCFLAADVMSASLFAGKGDPLEKHVALAELLRPITSLFTKEILLLG